MLGNKYELILKLESSNDDDIFELTKKNKKSVRSLQQIRYFWGVVVKIIGEHHGLTPIETNESLKLLFSRNTFTDLEVNEFKFVIDTIIEMWKSKYNVIIPLPEDKNLLTYIDNNY